MTPDPRTFAIDPVFNLLAENWRPLGLERFGTPERFSWLLITPPPCHGGARQLVLLLLDRVSARPVLVAKLPRVPGDHVHLDREIVALRVAQAARPSGFDSIPRVVATAEIAGRKLLIETALDGKQMTPVLLRNRFGECAEAVTGWLIEFGRATADSSGADLTALIDGPLAALSPMLVRSSEDEWLVARTLEAVEPLRGARLPAVFEHGDLFYPNILLRNGSIAVLDWETGEPRCVPAGDLLFFLGCAAFARAGTDDRDPTVKPFDDAFFPVAAWPRPLVRRYANTLGLDAALLTPLFVALWTRFLLTKAARMAGGSDLDTLRKHGLVDQLARDLHGLRDYRLWRHTLRNIDRLRWDL